MGYLIVQRTKALGAALALCALALCVAATANAQPRLAWQFSFGGAKVDEAFSLSQTSDGGYITCGYNDGSDEAYIPGYHGGAEDAWIVKLDRYGTMQWQKCFGGTAQEEANSVIQTKDGGYCVAVRTESGDGQVVGYHGGIGDAWILKLDATGAIEWADAIGGSNSDDPLSIIQTSDGGFAFTGFTLSNDADVSQNHGGEDAWVVKLNSLGRIEWSRCYGGSGRDRARAIVQMPDGGYAIAGLTSSHDGDVVGRVGGGPMDGWIVRLDTKGNILWQKTYGGDSIDYFSSLARTRDGGFIAAGASYSRNGEASGNHGGMDAWLVKIDSLGNMLWDRPLGSSGADMAWSVIESSDGGYVLGGVAGANDGDVSGYRGGVSDAWIVKLDRHSNIQWQQCAGGTSSDRAYQVIETRDGSYAFAGMSMSHDGDIRKWYGSQDLWIAKVEYKASAGNTSSSPSALSLRAAVGPDASLDVTYSLPDYSDVKLTLMDILGAPVKELTLNEAQDEHERVFNITGLPSGSYFVTLRACGRSEVVPIQILR